MPVNINPLEKRECMPNRAKLLRRLLEFKATGRPIDLWMTFPQNSCCFAFGRHNGPVPIGALFLLWSAGWPYLQECPECQGKAYMVAFGGFLAVGGGYLVCPTCENSWYQHLGGLDRVACDYIEKSPLVGTEFYPTGMGFGAAYTSDGKSLRSFLGVAEPSEPEPGVLMETGGQKFSQELSLEVKAPGEDELAHYDDLAHYYTEVGADYVSGYGEYDKGIAYLSKAIELGANDSGVYSSRGEAYLCKGKWDLAIADLNKAIQLEPDFPTNYWYRATAYYKKNRWDLAIADLGAGIALDPDDTYRFTAMGRAYLNSGCWVQAIVDFGEWVGADI